MHFKNIFNQRAPCLVILIVIPHVFHVNMLRICMFSLLFQTIIRIQWQIKSGTISHVSRITCTHTHKNRSNKHLKASWKVEEHPVQLTMGCQWVCHSHQQSECEWGNNSLRKMKIISIWICIKTKFIHNCRVDGCFSCIFSKNGIWEIHLEFFIQSSTLFGDGTKHTYFKQKCFTLFDWSNKKSDSILKPSSWSQSYSVHFEVLQVVGSAHHFVFVSIYKHINLNRLQKHWLHSILYGAKKWRIELIRYGLN